MACGRLFTRAKARQHAALFAAVAARLAMLDRIEWQLAELRRDLDRAAAAREAMMAEFAAC